MPVQVERRSKTRREGVESGAKILGQLSLRVGGGGESGVKIQ